MHPSRILAIESIEIESRPGLDEPLRLFYGEVVGLEEWPCAAGSSDGSLLFRSARLELRVRIVPAPHIDSIHRRATLLVSCLNLAAQQLDERGIPYQRMSGLVRCDRRLGTNDPAGNRVELKQEWPIAPL